MKRFALLIAVLLPLSSSGCSDPQVIAQAALTDEAGVPFSLADLPVRLLPYDRDAVLDSLEQAFDQPEPPIPPEVFERQRLVQEAQSAWNAAEDRRTTVQDSIQQLSTRLQGLTPGTAEYNSVLAHRTSLQALDSEIERQRAQSFAIFDQLRRESLALTDSIRVLRDQWAEAAFADAAAVIEAKLDRSNREELADTTDTGGVVRFRASEGQWWLYARYTLPYEELYWNVPVEVTGDSINVTLDRENAEVRPAL